MTARFLQGRLANRDGMRLQAFFGFEASTIDARDNSFECTGRPAFDPVPPAGHSFAVKNTVRPSLENEPYGRALPLAVPLASSVLQLLIRLVEPRPPVTPTSNGLEFPEPTYSYTRVLPARPRATTD